MEMNLQESALHLKDKKKFTVKYLEKILQNPYQSDFIVFNSIVPEIKSTAAIMDGHLAQALCYLSLSGLKPGIVINFGERSLTC